MRGLDLETKEKIFDDYNNKKSYVVKTKSGEEMERSSVSAIAQHYDISVSSCYSILNDFKNDGREVNWRQSSLNDSLIDTVTMSSEEIHESLKSKSLESKVNIETSEFVSQKNSTEYDETTSLQRNDSADNPGLKKEFTLKIEKEKYNNQSIVLYKSYEFLSEDDKIEIMDKVGIDYDTLERTLKTYNKTDKDFTIENKIADCLMDMDVVAINDETENHVDEEKNNQSSVLHACEKYVRENANNESFVQYVKGIIRYELQTSDVDVVEKSYNEIFSSQYKTDDNFDLANKVANRIKQKIPAVFQGSETTAMLSYDARDYERTVWNEIHELQYSETEIMSEEELQLPDDYVSPTESDPEIKKFIDTEASLDLIQENQTRTDKFEKDLENAHLLNPEEKGDFKKVRGEAHDVIREEYKTEGEKKGWKIASFVALGSTLINYFS